jgi:hypothetical protein
MLFDNDRDPYQQRNCVDSADYADVQSELDTELRQRLEARGDTFKSGQAYIAEHGYPVDEKGNPVYDQ